MPRTSVRRPANSGDDLGGRAAQPPRRAEAVEADARQACTRLRIQSGGWRARARRVARAAAMTSASSSLSPRPAREALQFLARPVVLGTSFIAAILNAMGPRWIPATSCLLAALLISGCESPPNKEMDQAQGAIDAAVAAGADKYATTEYSAATDALKNANNAVAARDYRLALNFALESHEHALTRPDAADAKARTRCRSGPRHGRAQALVMQGRTGCLPPSAPAYPAASSHNRRSLTASEAALQKAGRPSRPMITWRPGRRSKRSETGGAAHGASMTPWSAGSAARRSVSCAVKIRAA